MRKNLKYRIPCIGVLAISLCLAAAPASFAVNVTFAPYLQPGDNSSFGERDQMVIAWQTDETTPNATAYTVDYGQGYAPDKIAKVSGRVVDNYLSADSTLPAGTNPYGPHTNYIAILPNLKYDTTYYYKVSGPGLPSGGFAASFHTRKRGNKLSFIVEGDEGFFPAVPNSTPAEIVDYEARIAHLMYNSSSITFAGEPVRPPADLFLNTGDNVYTTGSEDTYRDFFFPIFNSDTDSNETGAPLLRSFPYYITVGNHDVGSTGVTANLLSDNAAPIFSGNTGGGDALAYFNNFYYPLNGAQGYDIQYTWNGDTPTANGLVFTYNGNTYTSPAAINAFRETTIVDSGNGPKQQFASMTNYSFDNGNTHFLYLDANPHLFDGMLPSGNVTTTPSIPFPAYPSGLANWVINDLDSSKQTWKVVVFHQPAFSSGDATELNHQMRAVAKILEDHGVNIVFNGHEHNYQRTLPIRTTALTISPLSTTSGPAVNIDTNFDGVYNTVPDGVLYLVEGAGGNRDFDGDFAAPRGSGLGVDQDDSATGTFNSAPGITVTQGPADWLDTNLTNSEMVQNVPGAGKGAKITAKFKSKVFSFGHVVIDDNKFTLWQISEPLQSTSSATATKPAPYGTDVNGKPLNDPIPDTVLNATTGALISAPATGTSALLDKFTMTKPDLRASLLVQLTAPATVKSFGQIVYAISLKNNSPYGLNGTQVRLTLPSDVTLASASVPVTPQGNDVVATVGRLAPGASQSVQVTVNVWTSSDRNYHPVICTTGNVTSGTALPVSLNSAYTSVR
jgi:uncharacterized repeat protein (TIGR01451 family)